MRNIVQPTGFEQSQSQHSTAVTSISSAPPARPQTASRLRRTVSHDIAGQQLPSNFRKHLSRSHLLASTLANEAEVISILFPGDSKPSELYVAFHIVSGYGDPRHDRGGIQGFESERLLIDGVLDANSGEVVELSEGRQYQLRAVLEDGLEVAP